jgi:hypothetical protein
LNGIGLFSLRIAGIPPKAEDKGKTYSEPEAGMPRYEYPTGARRWIFLPKKMLWRAIEGLKRNRAPTKLWDGPCGKSAGRRGTGKTGGRVFGSIIGGEFQKNLL